MTLQVLISTTNNRFFMRHYSPPFSHYLVINQTKESATKKKTEVFNVDEIGLSKSRNTAITKANADICLISDDDIVFLPKTEAILLQAFSDNPLADIITFQAKTTDGNLFKSYYNKQKWHSKRSIMRVSSWEIAFKKQSVLKAGLKFDEQFGLGAKFATGEENIFLLDALQQGLKILYLPIPIVIHPDISSGSNFNKKSLIIAKGAMFCRMFGYYSYIVALLFVFRKNTLSKFGLFKFYQLMLMGIHKYRNHSN